MTASHAMRPLAALLAAAAVAAPSAAARPFHHPTPTPGIAGRDVRSVDAHHAALLQRDRRAYAPTSSLAGTTAPSAYRGHPGAPAGGVDVAPLAGGLAAVVAAFAVGAGVTVRRRQARTAI